MNQSTGHKLSPKFFFLSLGVLVTLIASVSSFLVLLFDTLNQKFPDALNAMYQYGYNTYAFEGIRGAIATLIIVFPVYLVLSYFWRKASQNELLTWDVTIRKWMIYLILFVASVVIIVDLVTLVRYFVSGEITIRFVMKVLGALVVAALVGSYYMYEMKQPEKHAKVMPWVYGILGSLVVLTVVVWSFTVIGSPKTQRALRFDQQRLNDLQSLQGNLINFWQQKQKLPETLAELANPTSYYVIPVEPEGRVYEYKKTGDKSFELCATFTLPMPEGWQEYGGSGYPLPAGVRDVAVAYPYPGGANDSWDHQAGRTCYERTIDPDVYPPYPKAQ